MPKLKLENLANEILFDIFDYLRPIDIICAFEALNKRFQHLILQRRMHIDLSASISLNEFNRLCTKFSQNYSKCIYSFRLSNMETCGIIKLFLMKFPHLTVTFPNLTTISFIEPNEKEYREILKFKCLTSIHIKAHRMHEYKIQFDSLFDDPNLKTCVLSYDDVLSIHKLRPSSYLTQLVLDTFYINDLHRLLHFYPSLEYLSIQRLAVNTRGVLPLFTMPFRTLRTLKLNCSYTIRLDYIAQMLHYFPQLIRLHIIALGIDFLNLERWLQTLESLEQLKFLLLDIKAVSTTFDIKLTSSYVKEFSRRWHIAIDYTQDNKKYHLFTVPYRRSSFISTIYSLPIIKTSQNAFYSITDLYLKMNPFVPISYSHTYSNVRALQIYENFPSPIHDPSVFMQLNSMVNLQRLVHFELFIPLPVWTFSALLELTPCLRYFKTDYDILLTVTDHFENQDVCCQLRDKLEKFVLRRGTLPIDDCQYFLQIFSRMKHLHINLNTIHDLRQIAATFLKQMTSLLTLNLSLIGVNEQNNTLQWEGIINNVSYEIAKRHIKIWK